MTNENIFSGVKVVDLASFIAGPGAAVILSDFGADVIKVEPQLTEILDEVFAGQPLAHWREALDGAHITFGVVRSPAEVIDDPQLKKNDIVVPIEGAGENLKFTISSPMQVHDVTKVAARRAPEIGEHNDEVLKDLGFSAREISELRISGAIPQRLSSEEATA